MYINSFLNKPTKKRENRKTRSDKNFDIRIPIEDALHRDIYYESRLQGITMTRYATRIIETALSRNNEYEKVTYIKSPYIVHIKLSRSFYTELLRYSTEWHCSVREATYRVFMHTIMMGAMESENL